MLGIRQEHNVSARQELGIDVRPRVDLESDFVLEQHKVILAPKIDLAHRQASVRKAAKEFDVQPGEMGVSATIFALAQYRFMRQDQETWEKFRSNSTLMNPGPDVIANISDPSVREVFANIWNYFIWFVQGGGRLKYHLVSRMYCCLGRYADSEALATAFVECWSRYHQLATILTVVHFQPTWFRAIPAPLLEAVCQAAGLDCSSHPTRRRHATAA